MLLADVTYNSKLPVPIGVLYQEKKQTYEESMCTQIEDAKTKKGIGSIDELLDQEISKGKDNFEIDNRILFSNKMKYKEESYNLFRLEINNYLKIHLQLREKIMKILENNNISNK